MMIPVDSADPMQAHLLAFRRDIVPSFETLVMEYCKTEVISDEIASLLEDIGLDFVWLSELVNQEIKRRRETSEGST